MHMVFFGGGFVEIMLVNLYSFVSSVDSGCLGIGT